MSERIEFYKNGVKQPTDMDKQMSEQKPQYTVTPSLPVGYMPAAMPSPDSDDYAVLLDALYRQMLGQARALEQSAAVVKKIIDRRKAERG